MIETLFFFTKKKTCHASPLLGKIQLTAGPWSRSLLELMNVVTLDWDNLGENGGNGGVMSGSTMKKVRLS